MKITFLKFKKLIIIFFSLFVPLMFISLFRIEFTFTAPGFNDDISMFIEFPDNYESSGSFHTTSVISLDKITILQYLIGNIEKTVSVEEFPDYYANIDIGDLTIMSYLMKDDSLQTSLIVGILNSELEINYETYTTVYLTFDYLDEGSLLIGDKIIEVNNRTDIIDALSEAECSTLVSFKIIRDNQELTVSALKHLLTNGSCAVGAYLKDFSEIINTEVQYNLINTNTGGPSGGLMQALYIYNAITQFDISHGLKIAGTGTINTNGEVGYIGGVKQKIITADLNNIDIFFIPYLEDSPEDNYIEALKVYNTLDTDMILVGVSSFADALNYLLDYESSDIDE